ncbi:MAG TPA: PepSY domain-containing protein [Thermoanaerobaculia bacterium]|nr:PepSY domain-containing protein [Thermoanaerobaculia bacterium]
MKQGKLFSPGRASLALLGMLALAGSAWALEPKDSGSYLDQKEFFKQELSISSSHQPLEEVEHLLPNRRAWQDFQALTAMSGKPEVTAFIDPRSGAATNIMGSFPVIPGNGVGNNIRLAAMSATLGRPITALDKQTVGQAARNFVLQNQAILGIDVTQLGETRAEQVNPELWQINIPQTYLGVPVRYGRVALSISHGNVVVMGTETWGNVKGLSPVAKITGAQALDAGFKYAGGRTSSDVMLRQPTLEVMPAAASGSEAFNGNVGNGYKHLLTWTFVFRRPPDESAWEVIVDAHSGEVLAFQDTNQYISQQVTGGVYPLTNTEICPSNGTCGILQSGWPMPFADTGLASPNNFTNSAGLFDYTSGTVTTTLTGKYVDIIDQCGSISESAAGAINLGGANGNHDCTAVGASLGNTAASRTAFYELNKLMEMARGWLPTNTWLQTQVPTTVNISQTCNAFYSGGTVNFYRSGGGCRNTGEIAGVFDHEWGHGLDDNDAGGVLSSSSEGYADIAAIYRLQTSCVGHGFFWTSNKGCGNTADGTGFNANEAQQGSSHCDLDCSGVRDADWDKHADHTPDTPLGFVCTSCLTGTGPCGRQVHCAAAPARQAAWDFVARDLRGAPYNLDSQTAFVVANKIFYQGSGNIGSWHSCTCGTSASGCGATNGYMQWLTADDDNGNLNDGTPHMTALFNAFNRHGIACATPTVQDSGCAAGPTGASSLSATVADRQASLSWTPVSSATRYWVFRSEGHAGCDFGKSLIGETTGTSFTDNNVANGRNYYYNVVAAASSSACFGPVSNCLTVTPGGPPAPDFSIACAPSSLTIAAGSNGNTVCTLTSINGYATPVNLSCVGQPLGVSCGFSANPVTPTGASTVTITVSNTQAAGTFNFQVRGTDGTLTRNAAVSLTVPAVCLAKGASCTSNAQCCSNKCTGGGSNKTCK